MTIIVVAIVFLIILMIVISGKNNPYKREFQKSSSEAIARAGGDPMIALNEHRTFAEKASITLTEDFKNKDIEEKIRTFKSLIEDLENIKNHYESFWNQQLAMSTYYQQRNYLIDNHNYLFIQQKSTSENIEDRASVIPDKFNITDTNNNLISSYYEDDIIYLIPDDGEVVNLNQVKSNLEEISIFLKTQKLIIDSSNTTIKLIIDDTEEKFSTLINSDDYEDKAKAIPYAFNLKDFDNNLLDSFYDSNIDAIIISSKKGTVIKNTITNIIDDIKSFLSNDDLEITSKNGKIHLHGNNYKDPENYIPELVNIDQIENKENQILFGLTNGSREVTVDIKDLSHILIVGQSGSGKSIFLNWLIASFYMNCWDKIDDIKILDLKSAVGFSFLNSHSKVKVGHTPEEVTSFLDSTIEIMKERFEKLKSDGNDNWNDGYQILIIDEFSVITNSFEGQAKNKLNEKLNLLSQQGRAAGIRLIVGLQRATKDSMKMEFKQNLQSQFVFKSRDMGSIDLAFGDTIDVEEKGWHPKNLNTGRSISYIDGHDDIIKIQTPFADQNFMKELFKNKTS